MVGSIRGRGVSTSTLPEICPQTDSAYLVIFY